MIAFALILGLFLFWTFLGRGVIAAIRPAHPALRAWLLAPAVGLSVSVLCITWLSQWGKNGLAVNLFALPLFLGLWTAALIFFLWRRPVFPWKPLWIFAGITLFSLLYTAWPFFQFGLNWISYGNDDMTNYCLGAARTLDNGFYRVPTLAELGGTDYSQYFWYMHVSGLFRFGSEMLLSWVSAVTGLNPLQAFMPTIAALGLVQIWALAAIVLWTGRARRLAYATAFLLAASPLFLLGVFYQLIAQVGGLGLMLATLTLGCDILRQRRRKIAVANAFILGIVAACLCIFYPEISPFAGLALILYGLIYFLRTHQGLRQIPALVLAAFLTLLLLFENCLSYFNTLFTQSSVYINGGLFPYFVVPSGLPTFLGWMPMAATIPTPWISILILLAALLLPCLLYVIFSQAKQANPWACLFLVMLVVCLFLLRSASFSFSLFKMAMFLQPVLAASLALLGWFLFRKKFALVLVLYSCLLAWSSMAYAKASLGLNLSGFCQLPLASTQGPALAGNSLVPPVVVNSAHPSAIKIVSLYLRGISTVFPARDVFKFAEANPPEMLAALQKIHPRAKAIQEGISISRMALKSLPPKETFRDAEFSGTAENLFSENPSWIEEAPGTSLFNKARSSLPLPDQRTSYFQQEKLQDLSNHLFFLSSSKGEHYYLGNPSAISVFQAEGDPFHPGSAFNGMGRFFLFQVINPSPEIWLRMSLTRSFQENGDNLLPRHSELLATQTLPVPFNGSGAANIYVGPFQPVLYKGRSLFALNMESIGKQTANETLMDPKALIGRARDFSVVSRDEYKNLVRPLLLNQFPKQLVADPGLEYSGLYEEGWISQKAFFILGANTGRDAVRIKIQLPPLGDFPTLGNMLKVRINGGSESHYPLKAGNATYLIPCGPPSNFTRVDLEFEKTVHLSSNDQRPVAARLLSAELGPLARFQIPVPPPKSLSRFSEQLGGTDGIVSEGIFPDGWVTRKAFCILGPSTVGNKIVIKGRLLRKSLFFGQDSWVKIRLNDGDAIQYSLPPGNFVLEIPTDSGHDTTRIDFEFEKDAPRKAPDTRICAAQLSSIEVIPNLPVK